MIEDIVQSCVVNSVNIRGIGSLYCKSIDSNSFPCYKLSRKSTYDAKDEIATFLHRIRILYHNAIEKFVSPRFTLHLV